VVSHLGNFAHNVDQRIVLNHAIVYNETVRGGNHGYIFLTAEFYAHSCVLDQFVLPRAIDNHERTIIPKRHDSLIRLEIIVSVIIFTDVHTYRSESNICFYRNPDSNHRTNNIPSLDRASRCLICNRQIGLYLRTWCFSG